MGKIAMIVVEEADNGDLHIMPMGEADTPSFELAIDIMQRFEAEMKQRLEDEMKRKSKLPKTKILTLKKGKNKDH